METNSIGHENKYHLQVTFSYHTAPKNTEKKQRDPSKNPYSIRISQLQHHTFETTKHCEKVAP